MDLKVDPSRTLELKLGIKTAATLRGKSGIYDIAWLDLRSLKIWMRSAGGENALAETTLAVLLGHPEKSVQQLWAVPKKATVVPAFSD